MMTDAEFQIPDGQDPAPRVGEPDLPFETLVQGLLTDGFASLADFLPDDLVLDLRRNLQEHLASGAMHPAGIGRAITHHTDRKVRGDLIRWLDPASSDPAEQAFFARVEGFMDYLNRSCYTGLNAFEFHYAIYGPESFYRRHRDQFRDDSGRRFSLVTYLNADWDPVDGGALVLYPDQEAEKAYFPEGGRTVFFRSDVTEHEVLPTRRPRMSITGWLKRI